MPRQAGAVAVAVLAAAVALGACVPGAPAPPPAEPGAPGPAPTGFGEIRADCEFSHRAADDPIVRPGEPGAAHSHDFFGATTADAFSTAPSLRAGGTTCDPAADTSAYWFPTLFDHGTAVDPARATFYYTAEHQDPRVVAPHPFGLEMIAGDPDRTDGTGPSRYKWSCLGDPTSSTGDVPLCPEGSELELLLDFPDCWDGVNLDSATHRDHVAYSTAKTCPSTHPVAIPKLQFKLRWPTRGGSGITLASGNGFSAHGDFFDAWEPDVFAALVRNCLHAGIKCDTDGSPA